VSQNRRSFLLALVALAVVIAAVLLLRPREDPEPTSLPAVTPTATVATGTATAASVTAGADLSAPAVVAAPQSGSVSFTWSYPGSQPSDTFRVHVGTSAEDAQIADPVNLSRAAYSVKVRSGSPACLIAVVVRGGQTSPGSPAVCATAR
jgi:hypothetical protein